MYYFDFEVNRTLVKINLVSISLNTGVFSERTLK